jgi:hypothetical protein
MKEKEYRNVVDLLEQENPTLEIVVDLTRL